MSLKTKHPYYCEEANYRAKASDGTTMEYDSWSDFIDAWGEADEDYNLLFRWDWKTPECPGDGPYEYPLQLCYMLQRKGDYRCCLVKVTDDDEPAVREWLRGKWNHMRKLWEPLSSEVAS